MNITSQTRQKTRKDNNWLHTIDTIPELLPDEHLMGWIGLIHRLNPPGPSRPAMPFQMATQLGLNHELLDRCAELAGIDRSVLLRMHTMLPFQRAVVPDSVPVNEDGSRQFECASMPVFSRRAEGVRYCAACASEDVKFHGRSYWRRSHQLPGVLWCTKHFHPLMATQATLNIREQPGSLPIQGISTPCSPYKLEEMPPAVQRYVAVSTSLLTHCTPLSSQQASACLRLQYFTLFPEDRTHNRIKILDLVFKGFPSDWLRTTAPQRIGNQKGEAASDWYTIMRPWKRPRSTPRYLIALCALFDDADDALRAWVRHSHRTQPIAATQSASLTIADLLAQRVSTAADLRPADADLDGRINLALTQFLAGTPLASVAKSYLVPMLALEERLRMYLGSGPTSHRTRPGQA